MASDQTLDGFLAQVERRALIIARAATRSNEEALDIVQEAMLQLVRRYRTRDPGEWGPLFHTILQRRILDWYRRRRVRNWLLVRPAQADREDDADPEFPDHGPQPDEALRQRRLMQRLERALSALPIRQQQAVILRAWEGLDVAETARAMGCSAGSVKTHYARALEKLRALLGEPVI